MTDQPYLTGRCAKAPDVHHAIQLPVSLRGTLVNGTRMSAVSHRTVRWRGILILAAIVVLTISIGQTSPGHSALQKAALIGKPASYTSLAFQRPLSLPEQLSTKQTDIPIPFVIHNAGTDAHDYQWQMQLVQGTATRHVSSGTIHIASGRSAWITQAVQIPCVQGQVQVIVSLALPAESIDARAECRMPSR